MCCSPRRKQETYENQGCVGARKRMCCSPRRKQETYENQGCVSARTRTCCSPERNKRLTKSRVCEPQKEEVPPQHSQHFKHTLRLVYLTCPHLTRVANNSPNLPWSLGGHQIHFMLSGHRRLFHRRMANEQITARTPKPELEGTREDPCIPNRMDLFLFPLKLRPWCVSCDLYVHAFQLSAKGVFGERCTY